jgi:hypothetical protein
MIRVNDVLADFEAHHAPPSNLKYLSDCAARAGLWGISEDADCVEALFGKYLESSKLSCGWSRFPLPPEACHQKAQKTQNDFFLFCGSCAFLWRYYFS